MLGGRGLDMARVIGFGVMASRGDGRDDGKGARVVDWQRTGGQARLHGQE